ncbi:MAG: rhodanese-like domain-containing protein [Phycisphaeraceae bacterium]
MTTQQTQTDTGKQLVDLDPAALKQWLNAGDTVLIDVREPFEHNSERIEGAVTVPLGTLDPQALRGQYPGKRLVFHCAGGKRSAKAADQFAQGPADRVFHLAGGIEAWKRAGLPTHKPKKAGIPVMRQVQITAGSLVVAGIVLSAVSPWFLALSAFIGCGLVFAGVTGWCGMAKLLAAMPWNRA